MKCNIANGWCDFHEKRGNYNCSLVRNMIMIPELVNVCTIRKRINRLEKAYRKDHNGKEPDIMHLYCQWHKEKGKK